MYYVVRNHILDFLVSRSREFVKSEKRPNPQSIPVVRFRSGAVPERV
jgi:nitrate/nitrite transport system ATP-binding protein